MTMNREGCGALLPKMVTPSVLMCIGQGMFLFFLAIMAIFTPVGRTHDAVTIPLYVIFGFIGVILCIVGSSIAIARFSGAKRMISGPVCLLIGSALMLGLLIAMGGSIGGACRGSDDFCGIDIAFAVPCGVLCIVGLSLMASTFGSLKTVVAGQYIAFIAMLLYAVAILVIDPEYHYNWSRYYYYDNGNVTHGDGVRVAGVILGVLVLAASVVTIVGWCKTAKRSHVEDALNRDCVASGMQYPSSGRVGMTVEQVVQLQQWASGLSTDELKYVMLNPAMYQPEVIEICTRELANRNK